MLERLNSLFPKATITLLRLTKLATVVQAANLGTGYALGDTVTIPGTSLGGTAPVNNDVIIVTALGAAGAIKTFATAGVGAIGNGTINTVINVTPDTVAAVNTYVIGDKSSNFTVVNDTTNNVIKETSALNTTVSFNLNNYQRVVYTDKATAFDISGKAGDVYSLLKAGFGGTVNTTYEGLGIKLEDAGTTSAQIAQAIVTSAPFLTANPDIPTFVNNLYTNVMGVAPTPTQASPYITALVTGGTTMGSLLNAAAHLATFQTTIGIIGVAPATTGVLAGNGIDYIPQ